MSDDELRKIRGNDIAMIFQDPLSSLHPFYKVGGQLMEAVSDPSQRLPRNAARERARSSCSSWSGSQIHRAASTSTRMSSPAGCANA